MTGGAVPLHGGISLNMNRINRIIEIDEANMTGTVEPGVIVADFQNEVEKLGLFYPPDPASNTSILSSRSCQQYVFDYGWFRRRMLWRATRCEIWRYKGLCHSIGSRAAHRRDNTYRFQGTKKRHRI